MTSPSDEDRLNERQEYFRKQILACAQRGVDPTVENVHTTHCCSLHGCKYSDDECPVVRLEHSQFYACEGCDYRAQMLAHAEDAADAYSESVILMEGDRNSNSPPPRVFLRYQDEESGQPHAIPLAPCSTAAEAKAQMADLAWAVKCAYLAGVVRA